MLPSRKLPLLGPGLVWVFAICTTGCGSNTAKVRVINASPGEGSISSTVAGTSVASNLAYATTSGYTSVTSGSVTLQVQQSSSSTSVIDQSISLTSSDNYTVLVTGYPTSVAAVTLTDNDATPSSGNVNFRIIHAAPALSAADVYVVAPGTSLSSVSPTVSSLSFESSSGYLSISSGTYEIYFTLTGEKLAYIDSGPLTLSAGDVDSVVALDGSAGGFTSALLVDAD